MLAKIRRITVMNPTGTVGIRVDHVKIHTATITIEEEVHAVIGEVVPEGIITEVVETRVEGSIFRGTGTTKHTAD